MLAGNNPEDRGSFVELELVDLDQGLQLLHKTVMCPRQGRQITQRILRGSDYANFWLLKRVAGFLRSSWLLEEELASGSILMIWMKYEADVVRAELFSLAYTSELH